MTFFRNVWTDLVDKRLWPVALILLLALVAVPVLLVRGGGSDDHVDVAAAPAADGATRGVVAVETTTKRVALHGSRRDPFAPRGGGSSTDATTTTSSSSTAGAQTTAGTTAGSTPTTGAATPSGGGSSGTSTSGSTSSSTGDSGGSSDTSTSTSTGATTADAVVVRFGKAGADSKLRVVAPLEALPSRGNPIVVYLGVQDGQAVFLVSSDATPGGDAKCKPSKEVCQKAYVAPGHTVSLDVADGDKTTQYVIEVVRAGS